MEESTNKTRRVEAATSPPSVGSPPRTRTRLEAARNEDEVTEEVGRSTAEKAASAGQVRTPPASLPSPPRESLARELFPAGRDQALPGADSVEQPEAERDEATGLAEELLAAVR